MQWTNPEIKNANEYIIEAKEGNEDYIIVGRVQGNKNNFVYQKISPNKECTLRIKARNKRGYSEPVVSETVKPDETASQFHLI